MIIDASLLKAKDDPRKWGYEVEWEVYGLEKALTKKGGNNELKLIDDCVISYQHINANTIKLEGSYKLDIIGEVVFNSHPEFIIEAIKLKSIICVKNDGERIRADGNSAFKIDKEISIEKVTIKKNPKIAMSTETVSICYFTLSESQFVLIKNGISFDQFTEEYKSDCDENFIGGNSNGHVDLFVNDHLYSSGITASADGQNSRAIEPEESKFMLECVCFGDMWYELKIKGEFDERLLECKVRNYTTITGEEVSFIDVYYAGIELDEGEGQDNACDNSLIEFNKNGFTKTEITFIDD